MHLSRAESVAVFHPDGNATHVQQETLSKITSLLGFQLPEPEVSSQVEVDEAEPKMYATKWEVDRHVSVCHLMETNNERNVEMSASEDSDTGMDAPIPGLFQHKPELKPIASVPSARTTRVQTRTWTSPLPSNPGPHKPPLSTPTPQTNK
ncbi:hypothetical protein K504DRAFT_531846 [Pleomassaria siparia CBS 279.74]|uniref:Uncharacterized protein n=1 Tax=Pleomassaria siparia CBS 279.74 TaxID=1314801 RepID=A0A6G1KIY7_9PLEO|nr:hypothetical protein K504DRAFT_531846 [Pleomassaria siparia CBS 279.74]